MSSVLTALRLSIHAGPDDGRYSQDLGRVDLGRKGSTEGRDVSAQDKVHSRRASRVKVFSVVAAIGLCTVVGVSACAGDHQSSSLATSDTRSEVAAATTAGDVPGAPAGDFCAIRAEELQSLEALDANGAASDAYLQYYVNYYLGVLRMFERLADASPPEVKDDMVALRDAWAAKKAEVESAEQLSGGASLPDPMDETITGSTAFANANDWSKRTCGLVLFALR